MLGDGNKSAIACTRASPKRVCFSHSVIFYVTDDKYWKLYRLKSWELFAVDAERFKCRLERMDPIISPVLSHQHREKVWQNGQAARP